MQKQIAKSIGVIGGTALVVTTVNANFWGIFLVLIGLFAQVLVYYAITPATKIDKPYRT